MVKREDLKDYLKLLVQLKLKLKKRGRCVGRAKCITSSGGVVAVLLATPPAPGEIPVVLVPAAKMTVQPNHF
jgi:hypothetical protein